MKVRKGEVVLGGSCRGVSVSMLMEVWLDSGKIEDKSFLFF